MEKMIQADLVGIGNLLKHSRFAVPPHQRPYAWQDRHINDLYRDINDALKRKTEEYFLGTVVMAKNQDGRQTIIDGQQRLVTTSVLIAAIRDYFANAGQTQRAQDIQSEYLAKRDIRTQEETPHLYLIPEDRDFFVKRVVRPPGHPDRNTPAGTVTQQRLENAIRLAADFVKAITTPTQTPDDVLLDLLDFIEQRALVISVAAGDEANAFVIFEVLNDRGLDLSVADLLKNYVFRLAGDRVSEAQQSWQAMTTTITEVADEPDVKTFIRQSWIARNGLTREKVLYDAIKKQVTSKAKAVEFAKTLSKDAVTYAALSNAAHDKWKAYGDVVVEALEVIELAGVTQLRPLLLSVVNTFPDGEVRKAFPMIVGWTVRFLICGSGGSGTLEAYYADRAMDVSNGTIKNAADLWTGMRSSIPTDQVFEDTFATATVSKSVLAKYYLRVIEQQLRPSGNELVVNPDGEKVNLEHIMPQTLSGAWPNISNDDHSSLVKRLGNLTLLNKRLNSKAANADFVTKQKIFAQSDIAITKALGSYTTWSSNEIDARQRQLAKLAVAAWPYKPTY